MQRKGSAMPTRKRSKLPAAFGTKSTGSGGPLPELTSEDYVRYFLQYHRTRWRGTRAKSEDVEKALRLLDQQTPLGTSLSRMGSSTSLTNARELLTLLRTGTPSLRTRWDSEKQSKLSVLSTRTDSPAAS